MANNYLQFSAVIPELTREEEAWLKEQLQCIAIVDGEEQPAEGVYDSPAGASWCGPRFLQDNAEFNPDEHSLGFEYEFDSDGGPNGCGPHLWIYAEEFGYVDHVAHLVQKFLVKFRPDECWSMTWAYFCDKPRVDEFGGAGVFVTAKGAEWCYPETSIEEHVKAFRESQTGAVDAPAIVSSGAPAAEDPTPRTIRTGVHGITVDLVGQCGKVTSELRKPGDSPALVAAYDALEGVILAHACAGIDILSPAYLEGVETAIDAIWNQCGVS